MGCIFLRTSGRRIPVTGPVTLEVLLPEVKSDLGDEINGCVKYDEYIIQFHSKRYVPQACMQGLHDLHRERQGMRVRGLGLGYQVDMDLMTCTVNDKE